MTVIRLDFSFFLSGMRIPVDPIFSLQLFFIVNTRKAEYRKMILGIIHICCGMVICLNSGRRMNSGIFSFPFLFFWPIEATTKKDLTFFFLFFLFDVNEYRWCGRILGILERFQIFLKFRFSFFVF